MESTAILRKLLYVSRQWGFDPIKFFRAVTKSPNFVFRYLIWKVHAPRRTQFLPSLHDSSQDAGEATGHYFWQDLIVARWIYETNPNKHLDIGSRVDGFIAHLLSFRFVEVLDIRPITSPIENLSFIQGDAMEKLTHLQNEYDSVSSLHALEHFGLGRYGDPEDERGHMKGLLNIAECVALGGHLYISFPLGSDIVQFNTQRLINPSWPLHLLPNFTLIEYVEIPWKGEPVYGIDPSKSYKPSHGTAGLFHMKRLY